MLFLRSAPNARLLRRDCCEALAVEAAAFEATGLRKKTFAAGGGPS